MNRYFHKIWSLAVSNIKVIENYFYMTSIQLINSLFGILIYPYLIRILGAESYGLYVFAISVTGYFISFVSFGFSFPGIKAIVENKNNLLEKNRIVSSILSAKIYLSLISTIVFLPVLYFVPYIHQHPLIFIICYFQIFGEILFPFWYFQAMQKMKIVTYIQLGFKILSLPFIFIFIKNPTDNWIYAIIMTGTIVFGAITSLIYLKVKEKITIRLAKPISLKTWFKDALPFFWSSSTGTLKEQSVTIIIGAFFGMRNVALYDLANKIIVLPRMLTVSINGALFPKVIENVKKHVVQKIIRYETILGLSVTVLISVFGYWLVLLLGGHTMIESYPLAIILSVTVLVWLVVGSYINFIFVPQNRYYFVTKNQIVALGSFLLFCLTGLLFSQSIYVVVTSLTLSGLAEVFYCNYVIRKNKLL